MTVSCRIWIEGRIVLKKMRKWTQENSTCMLRHVGMNDSGIFRKYFPVKGGQGAGCDHSHR